MSPEGPDPCAWPMGLGSRGGQKPGFAFALRCPCSVGNDFSAWLSHLSPPCRKGSLLAISSQKGEQKGHDFSGAGQVIQIHLREAVYPAVFAQEAPGASRTRMAPSGKDQRARGWEQ